MKTRIEKVMKALNGMALLRDSSLIGKILVWFTFDTHRHIEAKGAQKTTVTFFFDRGEEDIESGGDSFFAFNVASEDMGKIFEKCKEFGFQTELRIFTPKNDDPEEWCNGEFKSSDFPNHPIPTTK